MHICVPSLRYGDRGVVEEQDLALARRWAGLPSLYPIRGSSIDFTLTEQSQSRSASRIQRGGGGGLQLEKPQRYVHSPADWRGAGNTQKIKTSNWGDADQLLDFTSIDNSAEFAASRRALGLLLLQGFCAELRGIKSAPAGEDSGEVTKHKFKLFRAGSMRRYGRLIRFTQLVFPQKGALYPVWQGMQYMPNVYSGRAKLEPLDNERYPGMRWATWGVLAAR